MMESVHPIFEKINANAIANLTCKDLFTPRVFPPYKKAERPVEVLFRTAILHYDTATSAEEREEAINTIVSLITRVEILYREPSTYEHVSFAIMKAQRSMMVSECRGGLMKYVRDRKEYCAAISRASVAEDMIPC